MPGVTDVDEMIRQFRAFAASCRPRAPLYARLADGVAEHPEVAELMLAAPPEQHNPTLLMAAMHDLVLRGVSSDLALFYPNIVGHPEDASGAHGAADSDADPVPVFCRVASEYADELREMIAHRRTQTNEIGRCATLLPVFGELAAARGSLAMVDVGTSAGLNQLLTRFAYRYDPGGEVGPESPVTLVCNTRGPVPVPEKIPPVAATVGLDSSPIDVDDDDAVRWLEACVWPDQADRFARLKAAVAMARAHPPTIRVGDAVEGVIGAIESVAAAGHPVITTTWVLNYLGESAQRAFVTALDGYGSDHDLSWVVAESPLLTPGLPTTTAAVGAVDPPVDATVVSLVSWRAGVRRVTRLGVTHPHGYWLHWQAPTDEASRPPW